MSVIEPRFIFNYCVSRYSSLAIIVVVGLGLHIHNVQLVNKIITLYHFEYKN